MLQQLQQDGSLPDGNALLSCLQLTLMSSGSVMLLKQVACWSSIPRVLPMSAALHKTLGK